MIAFNLIHMNLPTVQFGILTLTHHVSFRYYRPSLNSGAYIWERNTGIESIPKGQIEAASPLGIRPGTMRYVVLPQAIKTSCLALGEFAHYYQG